MATHQIEVMIPEDRRLVRNSYGARPKKSRSRRGSLPAEEIYVFDACAVVARLQGEEGVSVANGLLLEESHRCLVHAINACELYYDLFRR